MQIEVYFNGKRKYISTGVYVKPAHWDETNQEIIKHPQAAYLNNDIRKILRKCEDYETDLLHQGSSFSLESLTEHLESSLGINTFIGFCQAEIAKANHLKEGTLRHHRNTLDKLIKFGTIEKFSDLTYENIVAFNQFLIGKEIEINTIANQHKNIKVHINSAIKKGLFDMNKNPYIKFKVKKVKKSRPALTRDELSAIEEMDIPDEIKELAYIRHLFLFACYTGLRYSDVMNLAPINILEAPEGITLQLNEKKLENIDETTLSLPLYSLFDGKPQEILKQYMTRKNVFPMITNVHLNRMLKILAVGAGLKRSLTFHMARHTFGTILANKTGDPFLIKALMGHSKIETSMQYIHESTAEINKKLDRIEWN